MMKRKVYFRALICILIAALILPNVSVAASGSGNDSFYKELAALLNEQDDSSYFDSMELTVGSKTLTVDGETEKLDVAPEIVGSRTMLPIRAIAEAAGAEVGWIASSETITITSASGDKINCKIGSDVLTVNGQKSEIDVAPYTKAGRTYLPVRAVTEALEMDVDWDAKLQRVTLTAPYQTCRVLVTADTLQTNGLGAKTVLNDGVGLWVLQFDSPSQAKEAVETLQARGIQAEPDLYIPPIEEAVSSTFSTTSTHYSWGFEDCKFDKFLATYSSGFTGSGVVAVVDSGVDASHPFLKGRVLSGRDFVDGDNDANDEQYHGTHVAGTIIDCVGTSPVKILPVRVLNKNGSGYDSWIISGIKYAADSGADVINLSLGGTRISNSTDAVDNAITYAVNKGTAVVIAAGNLNVNTSTYCPAHLTTPGTLIVSAGDKNHNKAFFSNYGSTVDLMAPGVEVKSTAPSNSYKTLNGTSMAAPHVSAATMLIDLAWGKTLSPAQVEEKVHSATTYGKWTNQNVGYGFLDMSKAQVPASTPTPNTPTPNTPTPNTPTPNTPAPNTPAPNTPTPVASGTCGNNLTWNLSADGTLTISGTGPMKDYNYSYSTLSTDAPWAGHLSKITSVVINSGVTTIGKNAFMKCGNLTSVTISRSVTTIGAEAFRLCENLKSVTIPNTVTSIGTSAFASCASLTSVTIPNSVTSIGTNAFSYCTNLTSVTVPGSVTTISDNAFWACSGLTKVTIENGVKTIGYRAFFDCDSLTSVTIGNTVTTIGMAAFNGTGLTSVTIPNSVTTIVSGAFGNCYALTSVTIGSGVATIEKSAFCYDSKLADVYYNGNEAQWKRISIESDLNNYLLGARIHYNS